MAIRARAEEFNVNCSASEDWKQKIRSFAKEQNFGTTFFLKERLLASVFGLLFSAPPSRDQDLELLFDMAMSDYQPLCLGYGESWWSLVKFTLSEEVVGWYDRGSILGSMVCLFHALFICFICLYHFHIFSLHVWLASKERLSQQLGAVEEPLGPWGLTVLRVLPLTSCYCQNCYLFWSKNHEKTLTGLDRHGPGDLLGLVRTQELPRVGERAATDWEASLVISFSSGIMYSGIRSTRSRWWPQCVNWAVRRTKQQSHWCMLMLHDDLGCPFALVPLCCIVHHTLVWMNFLQMCFFWCSPDK